jgi:aminocarboxymuconate-semialdehyde decarboxylase
MTEPHRIDVHAHVVPPFWADELDAHGSDPSGTPTPTWWSPEGAIAFMDSQHTATGILSLTAPGVVGWSEKEEPNLTRRINEYTAGLVADRPDRFGMFATLPLPNVDAALDEIEHAFEALNADGVVMLSNIRGRYPGEAYLDPIWAELDRRHAVVLLHSAQPPLPPPEGLAGPLVDFPFDTTRAAIQLVLMGVTRRHPNLKIILVHGGGFLPYIAHRVAELSHVFDRDSLEPGELLDEFRRFYVDTALSASPAALPTMTAFVCHDRIMYGSDYPYAPPDVANVFAAYLDAAPLSTDAAGAINHGNALALFPRLAATPAVPS